MKPHLIAYESMGTHWEISIWDEMDSASRQSLQETIISSSEGFDHTYSRFISNSFVCSLATKIGMQAVPVDFIAMLRYYFRMFALSQKKFTPFVGNLLSEMGYDKEYSLKPHKEFHTIPDLDQVVEIVDDSHILLKQPTLFDFGALGKGYFIDKIAGLLRQKNIKRFLVNGSGDIVYEGNGEAIMVGLEDPRDSTKVIGKMEMTNGSLCSSGTNRRAWGTYHHIIDPQSGSSTEGLLASWVYAETATIADAMATALFLSPPEAFESEYTFEYLLLNSEMRVKRSKGFRAELF